MTYPTTLLMAAALMTAGCRADVEGYWAGSIGEAPAFLSLDQAGAVVQGEGCLDGACDGRARGEVAEDRLALTFGCAGCDAPPRVVLDLEITDDEMLGIAILEGCDCTAASCGCGQPASFERTSGYGP